MTFASPTSSLAHKTLGERYILLLCLALAGHAILGKTFAYIGVKPIFISEIVLLLGVAVFISANCAFATLATLPSLLLAALMGWVILRTIPYIGEYGVFALRDSAIVVYGALAFIVIALLLQDSRRLPLFLYYYRKFIRIFVIIMPILGIIALGAKNILPQMPGTGVPIISLRPGDLGVHLAGAAIFTLLGFVRPGRVWLVFLLLGMVLVSTQNRGGMLAMLLPIALATVLAGRTRTLISIIAPFAIVLAVGYALNLDIETGDGKRKVGPRQLVENIASVFEATNKDLDGTKKWRLAWWQTIENYTFNGEYFWTGKGFGVNLAEADGFVVGTENRDAPPLRSPHNANLTMLARAGVPGLVLWVSMLASWLFMMLSSALTARRDGHAEWSAYFVFVSCYGLAAIIDSSFDVALEGPILGFWLWSLFGLGVGGAMIYRANCRRLRFREITGESA